MRKWILAFCFLLCSPASGQVGKETGYWEFIKRDPKSESIATVWCDDGAAGGFVCRVDDSGERFVITAAHVVMKSDDNNNLLPDPSANIKVCFKGGATNKATVKAFNLSADVCWLECEIPDEIPALMISDEPAKPGDVIHIIGLGGLSRQSAPIRHWPAECTSATGIEVIADTCLIPGDSGGCILKDGEVVGVVSGGWVWQHERGFTAEDGRPVSVTWPCRGCNVQSIREVLGK